MLQRVFLQLLAVIAASAVLYEDASRLLPGKFDFIVVGGGTAGNVIANRLSENPNTSVLVLEAGPSYKNQFKSQVPLFGSTDDLIAPNPLSWNYTTIHQPGFNNRSLDYPRGFVLGGSSSINGMAYTRGAADDYDRYARTTGDNGWSWGNLQPYIRRNEVFGPPLDGHNTTGQFNPAVHGFHGINGVSLTGDVPAVLARVVEATRELPEDFPFNLDYNSGRPIGVAWAQATIKNGMRSSSATSYLADKYLNRPNLHVLVHAHVLKLVNTAKSGQPLTMTQVEFTQGGPSGSKVRVQASKEVILSAGSVNTPVILMHSGIGNRQELSKVGLPTILHQPSVGKNASDHPVTNVVWVVNSNDTYDELFRNMTVFNESLAIWNRTHAGVAGTNGQLMNCYKRLPANSSIFQTSDDPSSGRNAPHLEFYFFNGRRPTPASPVGKNTFAVSVMLMTPSSRGSVTLASNDPFQQPLIDPGALKTDFDIFAVREGIAIAREFVAAPVWKDYIIEESTAGLTNATTDAEIDEYIRNSAITAWHLTGTAAMTAPDAGYGVVNPDLKVKGVKGLRIVDASILPFSPAAHTQAPTYIVAERAADIIKSAWK